jgi:hypothetical protein
MELIGFRKHRRFHFICRRKMHGQLQDFVGKVPRESLTRERSHRLSAIEQCTLSLKPAPFFFCKNRERRRGAQQPYGPTTLDRVLVAPMTRQTTWPVPREVQDGVPTPEPPTFNQPIQEEPL